MIQDPDQLVAALGAALARLPELNDGFTGSETEALEHIYLLARKAGPQEKKLLWEMARENPETYQFSGLLQGLFWMVENRDIPGDYLAGLNRSDIMDYAFRETGRRYANPSQILDYLATNYSYVLNRQSAQRIMDFFAGKYGDCTEFSLLGGNLLARQGYQVHILTTRPSRLFNHVSIIFRAEGGYYLMDPSRTTITRVLAGRKQRRILGPLELKVWRMLGNFDRIYGPEKDVADLVRHYGDRVPYNLIPFEEYSGYINRHGRGKPGLVQFFGPAEGYKPGPRELNMTGRGARRPRIRQTDSPRKAEQKAPEKPRGEDAKHPVRGVRGEIISPRNRL